MDDQRLNNETRRRPHIPERRDCLRLAMGILCAVIALWLAWPQITFKTFPYWPWEPWARPNLAILLMVAASRILARGPKPL